METIWFKNEFNCRNDELDALKSTLQHIYIYLYLSLSI